MSAASRKPIRTPPVEPALEVIETFGIARAPSARGYVVVRIATQGDKVVAREVLTVEPEPRPHAVARAELAMKQALLLGTRGGEA